MAVKTCKKDCTQDNKEKFMSEAGRRPLGRAPEVLQPSRMRGPGGWEGEGVSSSSGNPPPVREFLVHILQLGQETAFLSYGRDGCVAQW